VIRKEKQKVNKKGIRKEQKADSCTLQLQIIKEKAKIGGEMESYRTGRNWKGTSGEAEGTKKWGGIEKVKKHSRKNTAWRPKKKEGGRESRQGGRLREGLKGTGGGGVGVDRGKVFGLCVQVERRKKEQRKKNLKNWREKSEQKNSSGVRFVRASRAKAGGSKSSAGPTPLWGSLQERSKKGGEIRRRLTLRLTLLNDGGGEMSQEFLERGGGVERVRGKNLEWIPAGIDYESESGDGGLS